MSLKDWLAALLARQQLRKAWLLLPSVPLLSLGIALGVFCDLGADVYTAFQQGLGALCHIPVGTVNLWMNIAIVLVFFFADRALIGIGSCILCLGLGPSINLWLFVLAQLFPSAGLVLRIIFCLAGAVFTALALAWYVPLHAGVQPMDMLVLALAKRIRKGYDMALYLFNAIMLAGALLLHGSLGLGSALNFLCVGGFIHLFAPYLAPLRERVLK